MRLDSSILEGIVKEILHTLKKTYSDINIDNILLLDTICKAIGENTYNDLKKQRAKKNKKARKNTGVSVLL